MKVYNSQSGTLLNDWSIGSNLDAITVSRDGKQAIITEAVPVSSTKPAEWFNTVTVASVYQVDLQSGAKTTFNYTAHSSDYVFADVAFTDNDTVLLSEQILPGFSGWAPLVTLQLSTGTFASHGSYFTQNDNFQGRAPISSSLTQALNPGNVLVDQHGLTSAQSYLVSPLGEAVANNGIYQNGVYGASTGIEAFAGTGATGHIAMVTNGGLYLYDGNYGFIGDLAASQAYLGRSPGLAFSADGNILYAINPDHHEIVGLRVSDHEVVEHIPFGNYDPSVLIWGEEVTLASSGQFFLVSTTQGIVRAERGLINSVRTDGDDHIIGTGEVDDLTGGKGNDILEGQGGDDLLDGNQGNDLLFGGAGNDSYYVDSLGDIIFENSGGGVDNVYSTSDFYLYANVETLELAKGAGNLFGVGNELDNLLIGNDGQNLLLGGAGADTVYGGAGNDALFGMDGADTLNGEAGVDYIAGGLGNDIIDGGAGADALYGEEGNDLLVGGSTFDTDIIVGGAGDDEIRGDSGKGDYDRLYGNEGNDVFWVDTPADLVFEQAGEGSDTVHAQIVGGGYYLYDNIETLILEGVTPFGVGNALDNVLVGSATTNWLLGGAGNDTLNGKGGNDVLFGEGGADVFVFEAGAGGDVVGDFTPGTDKIDLRAFNYSWAQVQVSMGENGGTSFLNLGNGDFVVLNGVAMATLHQGDFILV